MIASVIVPTYNRRDRLDRVLRALAEQTIERASYEVIVVSDGSTDGTDEYLSGAGAPLDVVAVRQANSGPGVARNAGVARARSGLVIFVDDDVVAAPDLIERHVTVHRQDGADGRLVVLGPMRLPPGFRASAWIRWEQAKLEDQYAAMVRGDWVPTFRQFYTGNASLSRALFDEVGGFDARYRRAEDVEMSFRLREAGCRFAFEPHAIGWHHAERSYRSWLSNADSYGTNDVLFARDLGRSELLDNVRDEFPSRHAVVRCLTRIVVRAPRTGRALQVLIDAAARGAAFAQQDQPASMMLSLAYNLAYYRALAAELGGPDPFRRAVLSPGAAADALRSGR